MIRTSISHDRIIERLDQAEWAKRVAARRWRAREFFPVAAGQTDLRVSPGA